MGKGENRQFEINCDDCERFSKEDEFLKAYERAKKDMGEIIDQKLGIYADNIKRIDKLENSVMILYGAVAIISVYLFIYGFNHGF